MGKFVLFDIGNILSKCRLGVATVTTNLLQSLIEGNHTNYIVYTAENETPIGTFSAKISDGKMTFGDSKCFGVCPIDMSDFHWIIFSPDSLFRTFGSGYCREININEVREDKKDEIGVTEKDFIMISAASGPKNWSRACLDHDELDFGEVIPVSCLVSLENEKEGE